jgi:hypothetical protein
MTSICFNFSFGPEYFQFKVPLQRKQKRNDERR